MSKRANSAKVDSTFSGASIADIFSAFGSDSTSFSFVEANAEFLNCLKLLDKKEPTTRARALQDLLLKVVPSLSIPELQICLPHFLRAYKNGALLDPDWKCRSLYHNCIGKICSTLGKSVEPSLREVASTWIIALFDQTNREVAANASRALDALFPSAEKRAKVFSVFGKELSEHLSKVLGSNPDSLERYFNKSSMDDPSFEARETWERLICACLQCATYLCDIQSVCLIASSLDPLRYLRESKFQSAVVLHESVRTALRICNKSEDFLTEFISDSHYPLVVANLLPTLSVEEPIIWQFLAVLSNRSNIKLVKLESVLSSGELRLMHPGIFQPLKSLLVKGNGNISVFIPIFLKKIEEAVSLDARISNKYLSTVSGLLECYLVACDIAERNSSLVEVFTALRNVPALRKICIEKTMELFHAGRSLTAIQESLRSEMRSVGPAVIAVIDASSVCSSGIENDVEELEFWFSFDPDLSRMAQFLADSPDLLTLWLSQNRESAFKVIARIFEHDSRLAEETQSSLCFADRVELWSVYAPSSKWKSCLKAPPLLGISLNDFEDERIRRTFIQAIEVGETCVCDGAELDNGLIMFGSEELVKLLVALVQSDLHEFKRCVITRLIEKRSLTDIPCLFPDSLVLTAWESYCANHLDISGCLFLPLFRTQDSLRKSACATYYSLVLLVDTSRDVDEHILDVLFPESVDRDELLDLIMPQKKWSKNILDIDPKFFQGHPLFLSEVSRSKTIAYPLQTYPHELDVVEQVHRFLSGRRPFCPCPIYEALLQRLECRDAEKFMIALAAEINLWNLFIIHKLASQTSSNLSSPLMDLLRKQYIGCNDVVAKCVILGILSLSHVSDLGLPELPTEEPLKATIRDSPGSEDIIFAWIETCFAQSALSNSETFELPALTYINSKQVAGLLVAEGNPVSAEDAFFRYQSKKLPLDEIDPDILAFLCQRGSLAWAVAALDLRDSTCVVERLMKFTVSGLLGNDSVIAGLESDQRRAKLWSVILKRFCQEFSDAGVLLLDFLTEEDNSHSEAIKQSLFNCAIQCVGKIQDADDSEESAALLALILRCVSPGEVHEWFSSSTKSVNIAMVERIFADKGITLSFISDQVSRNKFQNENLRSGFSASSRMLSCGYSSHAGEIQASLQVTFPDCWPLRLAKVEVSPVVGLSKAKNVRLQVSIQSVFKLNGVQKAIKIWIENIEGFLADVEECYICYSVTYHGSSSGGSIPSKQCRTCKNKFHSECLLKYFRTSGKTICCLCQNPF